MREARMGAQSHTSPDLSHEPRAVLQEFSPIPDGGRGLQRSLNTIIQYGILF